MRPPISAAWAASFFLAAVSIPGVAAACACGCNIFEVGGDPLLPSQAGGTAFVEYDFMDQNRNWSGTAQAPRPPTTTTRRSGPTSGPSAAST